MDEIVTLYNREGRAIAYIYEGEYIYLYGGKPVGYLDEESVYGFNGKHLGRFEEGWLRDSSGNCAFFTEDVSGGGRVRPVRKVRPVRGVRQVRPVKSVRQVRPVRPVKQLQWSPLSSEAFFSQ